MLAVAPAYPHYPARVGGVECVVGDCESALECLTVATGLMVRQPLLRISNPLADCDYHAVAAPYKAQMRLFFPSPGGRGAAGRHITKRAFCFALSQLVAVARDMSPVAAFSGVTQRAWDAFSRDPGYAEAMARAAAALPALVLDTDDWSGAEPSLELEVMAV